MFVLFVNFLVYRGVKISARWATFSFAFGVLLILVSMIAIIPTYLNHLTFASLSPLNIHRGIAGLGLGFPLAMLLFIGVGNPGAMVEVTKNARKNVPRSIDSATIIAAVLYVLMALTTSIAFHNNYEKIGGLNAPFITAAVSALGPVAILVYLAGLVSTFSSLLGATTAQMRIILSAGREGPLPAPLATLNKRHATLVGSLALYSIVAGAITPIWASRGNPLDIAGDIATLGTIPVILIYLALNCALPVYFLRFKREQCKPFRHLVIPILGILALVLPLWGLVKPGQPYPFNIFPYMVLVFLVLAAIYAVIRVKQMPDLAKRVGSVVADE
ncbi:MAG: APC family permease [Ferrimicrobium sp.]|nr:APC family permease [Ferrimicrobium sp.]